MANENNSYSYTLGSMKSAVFRALDEYSANGVVSDKYDGESGDIGKRFIDALNSALRTLFLSSDRRTKKISVRLGKFERALELYGLDVKKGTSCIIKLPEGGYSYCFLVTGSVSASILDDDGNVLSEALFSTPDGVFENIRDFVPESAEKICFETETGASVKNFTVFAANGASCGIKSKKCLPDGERVYCEFPKNALEISRVSKNERVYPSGLFSFSDGILSCRREFSGDYDIELCEYPALFTENSSDTEPIPLSPVCSDAAVYMTAANLCFTENGELYERLCRRYSEILTNSYPAENLRVKNSFFGGSFSGHLREKKAYKG